MKLQSLIRGLIHLTEAQSGQLGEMEITGLSLSSIEIQAGDLFIALAGANHHGLQYAEEAVAEGAVAILFDPDRDGNALAAKINQVPVLAVNKLPALVGELGARFYGYPSAKLDVIGITGTNGKTSCSHFLGQILDNCGIIGTLGWGEWGKLNTSINTTPDALLIQKILARFVEENKQIVSMEVSSHGLDQGRVNGVQFKGSVFTNLTRDHLDYHETMENYLAAKMKLFTWPGLQYAVINLDDENSDQIMAAIPATVKIWGISIQGKTEPGRCEEFLFGENVNHTLQGLEFTLRWKKKSYSIQAPVYGDFNAHNILCVIAVALAEGVALEKVSQKITRIKAVAGRMEQCNSNNKDFRVFVDYAHTPDALDRVLASIRQHCSHSLWVVFGCGGNRDAGKRPLMGKTAGLWADRIIITDDNPRHENNEAIAREVLMGCPKDKTLLIQDRKQAIEHAIAQAEADDCIVIAGKGHEDYQEIKGVRYPFSDKLIAEAALNNRFAA